MASILICNLCPRRISNKNFRGLYKERHIYDARACRKDLECLCDELQLEESVDDLMQQFGADDKGKISYAQFVICHKNIQLTPYYQDPVDTMLSGNSSMEGPPWRRRDPKNSSGRNKGARHWDWLGQASMDLGLNNAGDKCHQQLQQQHQPVSKEQLLLERRQRLQGKTQPQANRELNNKEAEDAHIVELTQRLAQVTNERDQLRDRKRNDDADPGEDQDWEFQCQRYEERIVELHSVIAELSRKLDTGRDDVILEESEADENQSYVTDSCLEEEDNEDVNTPYDEDSLAFERDLVNHVRTISEKQEDLSSLEDQAASPAVFDKNILYKIELFDELQHEVVETRSDNERLRQVIADRDLELIKSGEDIHELQTASDSLRRQLTDLQSTLEYQEAKMDRGAGRSSAERRSLRRKKTSTTSSSASGRPPTSPTSPEPETTTTVRSGDQQQSSSTRQKLEEFELDLAKAVCQVDHLRSQNDVLELTLDDAKTTSEKLSMQLARHESNATAMQLALAYADQAIEAYDVLVALLETEVAASTSEAGDPSRAQANRRSALSVARHLIGRYDKTFHHHGQRTTDSGIGSGSNHAYDHHGSSWEADSSGYSHTTSSTTSTNSSCQLGLPDQNTEFVGSLVHKSEEMRLREHICQLKTIRATIQGTVVDLEPVDHGIAVADDAKRISYNQMASAGAGNDNIEQAVLKQDLMAAKEEIADLKAKVYLADKEKSGLELTLLERRSVETMLRTHVHHLQEQVSTSQGGLSSSKNGNDIILRQRVDNLLDTLDKVIRNSDIRQRQANDLIAELKKANSTLSEALDKTKRKYQSKIKRLELKHPKSVTQAQQQLPPISTSSSLCSSKSTGRNVE